MNAFDLYIKQLNAADNEDAAERLMLLDKIIHMSTAVTLEAAKFDTAELMEIIDELLLFMNFTDVLSMHKTVAGDELVVMQFATGEFIHQLLS